ncbi:hypothetical protein P3W45_000158 [Vairimorpha bombi]
MEQNKPIPGTRPFKQQIMELRGELRKADNQIKEYERKIEETKRSDAKNSPKAPLLAERKELNLVIKDLNNSRKDCYDKMNQIKDTYGDIGQKQNDHKGFMSTESIEKRLKEINLDMLKYPCSSQKSKAFEDEIKDLKLKKKDIEIEQKKHEIMKQVQDQYYTLKSTVRDLSKDLAEKNAKMTEIMNSIKDIESNEDSKNPIIEGFEKNIESLKIKKEELNKKITANQEEIAKKKAEHDVYLQKKAMQEAYEKRRTEILDKIKDLELKKETMETEKEKCDASKFDSVIFYLENKTSTKDKKKSVKDEKISFPLDIVMSLTQFKVSIPSQTSQISETISQLNAKKVEFLEKVEEDW